MKNSIEIYKRGIWTFLFALVVIVSSCSKTEDLAVAQDDQNLMLKSATILNPVITYSVINGICGIQEQALIAGQNYTAGNVVVSTTPEGKLLISVSTQGGWALTGVQLYVGAKEQLPVNKSGNPVPGNFPVNTSFSTFQSAVSYEFNIADFSSCFVVALHANVSKLDEIGQVIQSETSWAAGTKFVTKGSWATYFEYCVVPCSPPPPPTSNECTVWDEDTAWGGTAAGAGSSWWFYYTGVDSQTIWAGQTKNAGSVVVENGVATITLNPGWELQPGTESVKIQGYNTLPTSRPAAGQFDYKGTELIVNVGVFTYYAIHLDVRKCSSWE
ncbi:MAG: hypothetical protein A2066_18065 [Bacteroidetes bacterium GWB2_41_8]|nr:MAG: hypothetical protein A2066_18065 [Bacteroidetes bacterium GWB2_41_8]